MRKLLDDYFDFSKREFNGLVVLIVLILLIGVVPCVYEYVNPETDNSLVEHLAIKRFIRYKQVNATIEYRKQHGNYSNIADLNKVAILNRETVECLAPYLTF